jgi:hypothetical protein
MLRSYITEIIRYPTARRTGMQHYLRERLFRINQSLSPWNIWGTQLVSKMSAFLVNWYIALYMLFMHELHCNLTYPPVLFSDKISPSGFTVLCYTVDGRLCLQPRLVTYTEHRPWSIASSASALTSQRIWQPGSHGSQNMTVAPGCYVEEDNMLPALVLYLENPSQSAVVSTSWFTMT